MKNIKMAEAKMAVVFTLKDEEITVVVGSTYLIITDGTDFEKEYLRNITDITPDGIEAEEVFIPFEYIEEIVKDN